MVNGELIPPPQRAPTRAARLEGDIGARQSGDRVTGRLCGGRGPVRWAGRTTRPRRAGEVEKKPAGGRA